MSRPLESALHDMALTPGQYTTLSVVKAGPISSADLARRVGITPQSMSEVIGGLERKGLARRALRDDNRRIDDIALTAEGKIVLQQAEDRVDLVEAKLFRTLSAQDLATLHQTLQQILN